MMKSQTLAAAAAVVLSTQLAHAATLPSFAELDLDRDGIVALVELRGWMEGLHRSLDRNGDGLLTVKEMTTGGIPKGQAEMVMSNNDMDQSGDLSVSELTILLPVLFDMADANSDTLLERTEYDAALAKAKAMAGGS